jgi:hypothetical protein
MKTVESGPGRERSMRNRHRSIGIALAVLFATSSLASPSLLVLCAGNGDALRIVPFHRADETCLIGWGDRCRRSTGTSAKIVHHHVRCTDFGLSGHIGLVKDRQRFVEIPCLCSSVRPVGGSVLQGTGCHSAPSSRAVISDPAVHLSYSEIESAILIV